MEYNPQNPLIVQGDKTILLEVNNPFYQEARATMPHAGNILQMLASVPQQVWATVVIYC
ncbi:MAG: hypothetical protein AAF614_44260 [Chloroflexota bacterium]